jgi:hypothetical protein
MTDKKGGERHTKIEGAVFRDVFDDADDEDEDDCDDNVDVAGNDSPTDDSLTHGVSSPSENRESQW